MLRMTLVMAKTGTDRLDLPLGLPAGQNSPFSPVWGVQSRALQRTCTDAQDLTVHIPDKSSLTQQNLVFDLQTSSVFV